LSELAYRIDGGLGTVVEAWPNLSPTARMTIETIVEAAQIAPSHDELGVR